MTEKKSNLVNLYALGEALYLVLQNIQCELSADQVDQLSIVKITEQLQEIEGVLRFISQESLAGLILILRDCLAKATHNENYAELIALCATIFGKLVFFLADVKLGRRIMAYRLMPIWRQLSERASTQAISPASLIALDMLKEEEILPVPDFISADGKEIQIEKKEIEHALLELIREELGSEKFSNASKVIGVAASEIYLNHPVIRQRYFWMLARLVIHTIQLDNAKDLIKAKKISASIVHALRQRSATIWPELPEPLVREILHYLSSSKFDSTCQLACAWFQLDLQLTGPETEWENFPDSRKLIELIDYLDSYSTKTQLADKQQRQSELLALSNNMLAIPFLVEPRARILEFMDHYLEHDELVFAILAMSLRECIATCLKNQILPSPTDPVFYFFKEIEKISSADGLYFLKNSLLNQVTYELFRPAAVAAFKSTMVSSLIELEPQLDYLFSLGDRVAAEKMMYQVLQIMNTSLVFLNDMQGVTMANLIMRAIDEREVISSELNESDVQPLAQSWVELIFHVEYVFANLLWVHELPSFLQKNESEIATNKACVIALDNTLRDIFIVEAKDRLRVLRKEVTLFSDGELERLTAGLAIEIHALAGSSATVGNTVMHEQALALENLINHVISLVPGEQKVFLPEILLGLATLEQQFCTDYDELSSETQPIFDVTNNAVLDTSIESSQETTEDPVFESVLGLDVEPVVETVVETVVRPLPIVLETDTLVHLAFTGKNSDLEILTPFNSETVASGPPAEFIPDQSTYLIDAELRLLFNEEAAELLPELDSLLKQWSEAPGDTSFAAALLRVLHTLKGSARMAGELELGQSMHDLEHRVNQLVQHAPVDLSEINLLQEDVHHVLRTLGLHSGDTSITPLISDNDVGIKPSTVVDQTVSVPSVGPAKLRVDLLDRATGSAAELLVNAVRASEQLREQKQLISDLADNLSRLRLQLRQLEMQSEASISAHSSVHSSAQASDFDPLEFDRYTRLQELTRMTTESMADLSDIQRSLSHQTDAALTMLAAQTRHARSLQSDLHRASMQVFSSVDIRYRQLVRQVALEVGRDVRFELEGSALEIDRVYLERLSGPLSHLLRNAIAHGIESADERERLGKTRQGHVRLALSDHLNEFRLQISDDGQGLNFSRIREQAIARGLIPAHAEYDTEFLTQLIFEPGFSTAEKLTDLAGRGIGMDAVKATVSALGGALNVTTHPGQGTSITIALPKLTSTQQIIQVSDGNQQIALPSLLVQQVVHITAERAEQVIAEGLFEWQDRKIPACSLSDLIQDSADMPSFNGRMSMLILQQRDHWLAVKVSEVHGHHEVVVKQPSAQLMGVTGLIGAALLADGEVILVMNLLQLHSQLIERSASKATLPTYTTKIVRPLVMVVDDSLTVRRVSQRMLEKYGYSVVLAKHGAQALEMLRELSPVALLLDIEMPTMDGFELLSRLRADKQFSSLPVAMITSRMAERHREHAMQLGANAYFGKPYREQEIILWLAQWAPTLQTSEQSQWLDKNQMLHAAA